MGIGIALGGVAQGLESAERTRLARQELETRSKTIAQDANLRTRALDIQQKQLDRSNQQDLLSQADKIIGDQLTIVGKVIKEGKAAGHSAQELASAVEPLLADVDRLSQRVGRDSGIYRKQVEAMLTTPTGTEAAAAEGEATAAKSKAQAAAGDPQGNVIEGIKSKIAAGTQLTPGEERLYQDDVNKKTSDTAEMLRTIFGEKPAETAPAAPAASPAQPASPAAGIPPVPPSLAGKGAMWSPSKQRWYTPDGASYNQQGVPVT